MDVTRKANPATMALELQGRRIGAGAASKHGRRASADALSSMNDMFHAMPSVDGRHMDFPTIEWSDHDHSHGCQEADWMKCSGTSQATQHQSVTPADVEFGQKRPLHAEGFSKFFHHSIHKRRFSAPLTSYAAQHDMRDCSTESHHGS